LTGNDSLGAEPTEVSTERRPNLGPDTTIEKGCHLFPDTGRHALARHDQLENCQ
jgi:hypothetical protein